MGTRFIKVAVIYFLIGTVWGLVMGATQHMEYMSAHAHINLLGWASLAIIGVIYRVFPQAGEAKLAKIQFWLHNIGLPLLVISMVLFANGDHGSGIPFAVLGGVLVIASVIVFTVNLFKRLS
ncbi:MAG: cytochrome-c oxidase [Cohnella sp.]|nr:cytochrome-c oxidase [Cohnella sp.]